jgi:sulfate transport system permease protein
MAKARSVLPGFRLSLSYTLVYLGLFLGLPLIACLVKLTSLTGSEFVRAVWTPRTRSAYMVTFSTSIIAAIIDTLLGLLIAWVLVRYKFFGKRIIDAMVDLPFALPTSVAGLVYSNLYYKKGWFGQYLYPLGIEGAYSRTGIVLVLTFIGLPFVVRAVQPVLETLDAEVEEAAACLGASRWTTFSRVLLPALFPALLTGFSLTLARAIGEYGSVVFISANKPFKTEIAPVLIVGRLEAFEYAEATAIAVVLMAASFSLLIVINFLERWSQRHAA